MNKNKIRSFFEHNMVTLFFVLICILTFFQSGLSLEALAMELFSRIGRNTFIVLALIIPVLTGMGLNFSLVIGAMAAQIGIFVALNNGFSGMNAFFVTIAIAIPISIIFGILVGRLFNRMKGSEMIGGMVLGYFANGLYQFLFLFLIGTVFTIKNPKLAIAKDTPGVINSIDLTGNMKYVLDNIALIKVFDIVFFTVVALCILSILYNTFVKKKNIKQSLSYFVIIFIAAIAYLVSLTPGVTKFLSTDRLVLVTAIELGVAIVVVSQLLLMVDDKTLNIFSKNKSVSISNRIVTIVVAIVIWGITYIPAVAKAAFAVKLPVMTFICILALYLFNGWIINTRLGQNMRTVGQDRVVANAAGISVDRTRIIAMVFSTVLASLGQLIYLQNIGTFQAHEAHTQVSQIAIASLLVGGASVDKATSKQAVIGVCLYHALAILSPAAGTVMFNSSQIGEYFRRFLTYAVIAVSLALHAYNLNKQKQRAALELGTTNAA